MRSIAVHLHHRADSTYQVVVTIFEPKQGVTTILSEESHALPYVLESDALAVASQMAVEAIRALEPSPGLWEAAGVFRSDSGVGRDGLGPDRGQRGTPGPTR